MWPQCPFELSSAARPCDTRYSVTVASPAATGVFTCTPINALNPTSRSSNSAPRRAQFAVSHKRNRAVACAGDEYSRRIRPQMRGAIQATSTTDTTSDPIANATIHRRSRQASARAAKAAIVALRNVHTVVKIRKKGNVFAPSPASVYRSMVRGGSTLQMGTTIIA